ncbi:MAG: hypothetical protein WC663_02950 [Patescibacteria group bacterium]|jgi:hypothetical protein
MNNILTFFKTKQKLKIFVIYFIFGIIVTLPAIFLIPSHLAIDPSLSAENARYFDLINNFDNKFTNRSVMTVIFEIFNPLFLGYLLHLVLFEPLAFNIFWLLFFPFGAFGGFLLLEKIFKKEINILSIIFGGIIFGLLSLIFFPVVLVLYFIFFLLKFLDNPSPISALLTLLSYIFIVGFNLFFAICTLLLTIIIITFRLVPVFKDLLKKENIYNLYKIAILFLMLIFIFGLKYYFLFHKIEPFGLENQYFLYNSFSLTDAFKNVIPFFQSFAIISIVGIAVLLLIILLLVSSSFTFKKNRWVALSFFLSILFFVFSLGPYLKTSGQIFDTQIPLPYIFLYRFFPYFNQTVDLREFLIFALIFFIIVLTAGLNYFFLKFKLNPNRSILITSILVALIFTLSWIAWKPSEKIPEFYKKLSPNEVMVYLTFLSKQPSSFLYNKSDTKNNVILNQSLFFENRKNIDLDPIVNNLTGKSDQIYFIKEDSDQIINYFRDKNVKYLVIDSQLLEKQRENSDGIINFRKIVNFVKNNAVGTGQLVGDKLIYRISNKNTPNNLIVYQGKNWSLPDFDPTIFATNGIKTFNKERWMLNDSTFIIQNISTQTTDAELYFEAKTEAELRNIYVTLNNENVDKLIISPNKKAFVIILHNLKQGKNIIQFHVKKYSGDEIENIDESNKIRESVQFNNVRIKQFNESSVLDFSKELELGDNSKIMMYPEINELNNKNGFVNESDFINAKEIIEKPSVISNIYFNDLFIQPNINILDKNYYYKTGQDAINKYNVRYIGIYKKWLSKTDFTNLVKFIISNTGIEDIQINNDELIVFKLKNPDNDLQPLIEFVSNWDLNYWNPQLNNYFNLAYSDSKISIINSYDAPRDINFSFKINETNQNRKLKIYLNEDWTNEQELFIIDTKNDKDNNIVLKNLKPGNNEITFKLFDENNNEIFKENNSIGTAISKFKAEIVEMPINEDLSNNEYCDALSSSKIINLIQDNFEDEKQSREKWQFSPSTIFSQKEKIEGKQSIKFNNETGESTGEIKFDNCPEKITTTFMINPKKFIPGADLSITFTDNNPYSITNFQPSSPNRLVFLSTTKALYLSKDGKIYEFKHNLPLNEWSEIKLVWTKEGKLEFYENNELVLSKDDYGNKTPVGFKIAPGGVKPKENLDIYFDDFKLNFE